jgi:hypothetical protein
VVSMVFVSLVVEVSTQGRCGRVQPLSGKPRDDP